MIYLQIIISCPDFRMKFKECLTSSSYKKWFLFERKPLPDAHPCVCCNRMPVKYKLPLWKCLFFSPLLVSQWVTLSYSTSSFLNGCIQITSMSGVFRWKPVEKMFDFYLFSIIQVLVKQVEAADVETDFGVWLTNGHENPKSFRIILFVSTGDAVIPLSQSVHKRHFCCHWDTVIK